MTGSPDSGADAKQVLKIAAVEFAQLGFEGMSMRVLAEKCAVSTTWIYYHFGSKEALFQEACGYAVEETFAAVIRRLKACDPSQRSPDQVSAAFFDEWILNKTTLLLVQRDVISTYLSSDRWLTSQQYGQTLSLMNQIYSAHFGREPEPDFAFALASFMYGVCSLMVLDQRAAGVETLSQAEQQAYITGKRQTMLRYCRRLWQDAGS